MYRFILQTKENIIFIINLQPISGRVAPKFIHEHSMQSMSVDDIGTFWQAMRWELQEIV